MLPPTVVPHALIAFFYSGIFWMMVWFVIENRRTPRDRRKPLEAVAVALMVVSAYLMLGVVTSRSTVAEPPGRPRQAALAAAAR
jgi:hypothetical protein